MFSVPVSQCACAYFCFLTYCHCSSTSHSPLPSLSSFFLFEKCSSSSLPSACFRGAVPTPGIVVNHQLPELQQEVTLIFLFLITTLWCSNHATSHPRWSIWETRLWSRAPLFNFYYNKATESRLPFKNVSRTPTMHLINLLNSQRQMENVFFNSGKSWGNSCRVKTEKALHGTSRILTLALLASTLASFSVGLMQQEKFLLYQGDHSITWFQVAGPYQVFFPRKIFSQVNRLLPIKVSGHANIYIPVCRSLRKGGQLFLVTF